MSRSRFKTIVLALAATFIAVSLVSFPQESVNASKQGLKIWWGTVFPSLLPFFIICELLINFGVVKFIGVILEPLMKPLFKVPGVGGFVWAMGMVSGFPTGARLTVLLRQEKQLSKVEAERLVCFTNSSSPLFIIGAVSISFFHNAQLGAVLILSHYLGNICIGLMMRFYGKEQPQDPKEARDEALLRRAFSALHTTRMKEKRPIGKLLGDAVISSVHTLLMIGGFIILFSVINRLLSSLHITRFLGELVAYALRLFHLPEALSPPLISGLFEITLGGQMTSQVHGVSLMHKAIIISFILAFSGLSVQAQVASLLAQSDISFKPFFVSRIIHGFLAGFFTFLLWEPVYHANSSVHALPVSLFAQEGWFYGNFLTLMNIGPALTIITLMIYIIIFIKRMKNV